MKLATLRTATGTTAVVVAGNAVVTIEGATDVGALLTDPAWRERAEKADGTTRALDSIEPLDWAPVIPAPSKIVCVGLNYRNHILEMGRELPEYPTLFTKYPEALIGPYDPIQVPPYASEAVDWEGELAVVIGTTTRRASVADAPAAIAGYTVLNDVTMRDYQYRTTQWDQGKTFEKTTPIGPWLVTSDEYSAVGELKTEVDGEVVQQSLVEDLVFDAAALVAYISAIYPLNPGDVIATGTPGGVGHARKPQRYLGDGMTLTTTIAGLGTLTNVVEVEGASGRAAR